MSIRVYRQSLIPPIYSNALSSVRFFVLADGRSDQGTRAQSNVQGRARPVTLCRLHLVWALCFASILAYTLQAHLLHEGNLEHDCHAACQPLPHELGASNSVVFSFVVVAAATAAAPAAGVVVAVVLVFVLVVVS